MRRKTKFGLSAAALGLPLLALVLIVGLNACQRSTPGATPSLFEGRLAECPKSPNCVCSQDADPAHQIAPLTFTGAPGQAMTKLAAVIESMPRTKILTNNDGYIYATFTTALMRFVDDVEFLLDPESGVVHVRSASRVGKYDFEANRKRVEKIRQKLAE